MLLGRGPFCSGGQGALGEWAVDGGAPCSAALSEGSSLPLPTVHPRSLLQMLLALLWGWALGAGARLTPCGNESLFWDFLLLLCTHRPLSGGANPLQNVPLACPRKSMCRTPQHLGWGVWPWYPAPPVLLRAVLGKLELCLHTPCFGAGGCGWLRSHPGLRDLQPRGTCVPVGMSLLLPSDAGPSRDVVPRTLDVLASSPAGNRNLESLEQQLGECSPPSAHDITVAPPAWKGPGVSMEAGTPGVPPALGCPEQPHWLCWPGCGDARW